MKWLAGLQLVVAKEVAKRIRLSLMNVRLAGFGGRLWYSNAVQQART